jgi:hypothetical protein
LADGFNALVNNTVGTGNTALGDEAAQNVTSGSNNVIAGFQSCSGIATADNVICFGASVAGADVSNRCYIGNISDTTERQTATIALQEGQIRALPASLKQQTETITAKLEATDGQQQKQIDALTAGLQKVSTQLELSRAAVQRVLNNRQTWPPTE